jgi:hypothetical protein
MRCAIRYEKRMFHVEHRANSMRDGSKPYRPSVLPGFTRPPSAVVSQLWISDLYWRFHRPLSHPAG